MKVRFFCIYRECAEVVGGLGFVGALVEVPVQLDSLETLQLENFSRDIDGHAPAYKVPDDACKLFCPTDFVNRFLREHFPVVPVFPVGGEYESAARRFEVEVFIRVGRIPKENFDAGIFPAAVVVFLDFCSEAVDGLLDGKGDGEIIVVKAYVGEDRGEFLALVLFPREIRL